MLLTKNVQNTFDAGNDIIRSTYKMETFQDINNAYGTQINRQYNVILYTVYAVQKQCMGTCNINFQPKHVNGKPFKVNVIELVPW